MTEDAVLVAVEGKRFAPISKRCLRCMKIVERVGRPEIRAAELLSQCRSGSVRDYSNLPSLVRRRLEPRVSKGSGLPSDH
jgi:hypothetical protein